MIEDQIKIAFWARLDLEPLAGGATGQRKGRGGAGFFSGLLLWPLGWLIAADGPDLTSARICSASRAKVPDGATNCMHCGSDLAVQA